MIKVYGKLSFYGMKRYNTLYCYGCCIAHLVQDLPAYFSACDCCHKKRVDLCKNMNDSWWSRLR